MATWWRVSCDDFGSGATQSVLAPTSEQAAINWAKDLAEVAMTIFEFEELLKVNVQAEDGNDGILYGPLERFEVKPFVIWQAFRIDNLTAGAD